VELVDGKAMIGGFFVNEDSERESDEDDYGNEDNDVSTRNDDIIFSTSKSISSLSNRNDAGLDLTNSAKSQLHNSV